MALHGLDMELESVVAGTTEPMIGEIRLAWWREALQGLDAGRVPAQPLLQLIAAEVLPSGVTGAALAGLEDRWAGLIGAEDVPEAHFTGGGDLFAWLGRLAGGDETQARALGTAWAAGEAPPRGGWRRRCGRCWGWANLRRAMRRGRGPGRRRRRGAACPGSSHCCDALPLAARRGIVGAGSSHRWKARTCGGSSR